MDALIPFGPACLVNPAEVASVRARWTWNSEAVVELTFGHGGALDLTGDEALAAWLRFAGDRPFPPRPERSPGEIDPPTPFAIDHDHDRRADPLF